MIANAACAVTSVRPNFRDGFAQGMSTAVINKPFVYIPNASHVPRVSPSPAQIEAFRTRHNMAPEQAVLVYFGLLYPDRGVEHVFSIADPEKHRIFIVGDAIGSAHSYKAHIAAIASRPPWQGRATLSGFLPANECGFLLALADAVVLPFARGGGIWNTSLHAARTQGTFVLATSQHEKGYDRTRNVYWAKPGDVVDMRHALETYLGTRTAADPVDVPSWRDIALQHRDLYQRLIETAGWDSPRRHR
jgi:glycosyltransferase involved in cell wall biosynthesis